MVRLLATDVMLVLFVVDAASALFNASKEDAVDQLQIKKTRRAIDRSTSSSSTEKKDKKSAESSSKEDKESLDLSSSGTLSEDHHNQKEKYKPKSSEERKGWKKWHRKCTACPEDVAKKWRDPSIKWICGGYQRARRSFKSPCMMHYRNCQDGTMFVEIYKHRCANDTPGEPRPHGDHFFYDYKVKLSDESSSSGSSSYSEKDSSSTEARRANARRN